MFKLQNILRSAVAMTLLLLAGAAGAQSESAEKALAQLVKDVQRLAPSSAKGQANDGYYQTLPGDTVDHIIAKMLPNLPVNKSILRQAIVKANPHAFKRDNQNWMYANKKLRLPGADDIHNVIFTEQADTKKAKRQDRGSWIKYP